MMLNASSIYRYMVILACMHAYNCSHTSSLHVCISTMATSASVQDTERGKGEVGREVGKDEWRNVVIIMGYKVN